MSDKGYCGACSCSVNDDRRRRRPGRFDTGTSWFRYGGAIRCLACLSSVTYVLWLNGASYQKNCPKKQTGNVGLWGIEWSRNRWKIKIVTSNTLRAVESRKKQLQASKCVVIGHDCASVNIFQDDSRPTVWVKKNPPPPEGSWLFSFFHKRLRIFNRFLHTYYRSPSTLDCKFLFNYPRFWRSYAILSATT